MLDFIRSVSLIRYLIVWRVNASLVLLPRYLPSELWRVLGTLIAERLPTQQAREWKHVTAIWGTSSESTAKSQESNVKSQESNANDEHLTVQLSVSARSSEMRWPIEVVLFAYPNGKRALGCDEAIVWELKLLGDDADHAQFMEVILPALEEAARTTDPRWHQTRTLWGRFDIQAVYAARGAQWEPVVSDGQLNPTYRATPGQWAEGLTWEVDATRAYRHLTWITPFDLGADQNDPPLSAYIDALMQRMTLFLPGPRKRRKVEDAWALLDADAQTALRQMREQAPTAAPPPRRRTDGSPSTDVSPTRLYTPPRGWPGRRIGQQTFDTIPPLLVPYLELASILHIGQQTQLGCGTFMLS